MQKDSVKILCEKFKIMLPPDFWDKMEIYTQLLIRDNDAAGLLAPQEMEILWERHILDSLSLMLFQKTSPEATYLDFGSGAGLPGIVLACAMPEAKFILAESISKKAAFLQLAIKALE